MKTMHYRLVWACLLIWETLVLGQSQPHDIQAASKVINNPILFVVRYQYQADHHNTATLFQNGEINSGKFRPPGSLKSLDMTTGQVRTILDAPDGVIRDPEVGFDGKQILFSMRTNAADDYHIYEINADGTHLRQLTHTAGVNDIDPLYLPDGRIVFSSTHEPKYCMCNRHIMANLFVMESDGSKMRQLGKSTLFEGHSALLPDGRIIYDRWEYIDRNFGDAQGLWTVYPDGTNHAVYWGNNSGSPGGVIDPRPIPGTQWLACIFGSCHDRPWGALTIIDRRLATDGRHAMVQIWPEVMRNKVDDTRNDAWDTFMATKLKYEDPWPLDEQHILCSRMTGQGEQMGIYLIDTQGDETLLHFEKPGCYDPMPLAPRVKPPVITDRIEPENLYGQIYLYNAYEGTHMAGVKPGEVKWLRVIESPEKRSWTHPSWNGQGQQAPAMNWHSFESKRILGTVPVEADGSAYFKVPAGKFVYFQLLDINKMMIQSMRSGTIVQPGEAVGCIGCHEPRQAAPQTGKLDVPIALRKPPHALSGWMGPARMFSYLAEVQPIFDHHCLKCHDYEGRGADKALLAPDKSLVFNASYMDLWRQKLTGSIGGGPAQIQPAYSWGSHNSRLIRHLAKGHKDVSLSREEMERLTTWIDLNGIYYPEYSSAYPDNPAGRAPITNDQLQQLGQLTGVNFGQQLGWNTCQRAQISFDRPELSLCLRQITDLAIYKKALAIIESGRENLQVRPRADMPGFKPCPTDLQREEKYRNLCLINETHNK